MDLKAHIKGLAISCPMDEIMDDCPFNQYRTKNLAEIDKKINLLTNDEIIILTKHHKKCLSERLNNFCSKNETIQTIKQNGTRENLPFYHFLTI